jgi:hypothetical protein
MRVSRARDRASLFLAACVAALGIACDGGTPEYRVSLRLENGMLARTLALVPQKKADGTPGDPFFPEARAAELTKLYGPPAPDGSFTGRGPGLASDLGGSATLERQVSPLGTLYAYRERMQGSDRPLEFASQVQRAVASAQALSEGWLRAELAAHPAAASALDAWLRERVLPDAASCTFYSWLVASGLVDSRELEERFQQFIVERGYFKESDLPLGEDSDEVWRLLTRRALEQKGVEIDADLEAALARLAEDEYLWASLTAHVVRSQPFRTWSQKGGKDPAAISEAALQALAKDDASPEAKAIDELVEAYLGEQHSDLDVVSYVLFLGPHRVGRIQLTLALPEPPLETNGGWDAEAGQIRWSNVSMRDALELSSFAYARFSEPAREYQAQHFGRTLLRGERLAEYVAWRAGLAEDRRQAWDAAVDLMRPGDGLRERIAALESPATPTDAGPVPSKSGAVLLLEGFDESAAE